MKKVLFLLTLYCGLCLTCLSQGLPRRPTGELIDVYKTGFITRRLNLTTKEAQDFWPIYNQYNAEVREANIVYRYDHNKLQFEKACNNIQQKYSIAFLKAIPPGKINDLFKAERDFEALVRWEKQRRQSRQ